MIKTLIQEKYQTIGKMMEQKKFTVTRQHLYKVVRGEINTTLDVAADLASALGITMDKVYTYLHEAQVEFQKNPGGHDGTI